MELLNLLQYAKQNKLKPHSLTTKYDFTQKSTHSYLTLAFYPITKKDKKTIQQGCFPQNLNVLYHVMQIQTLSPKKNWYIGYITIEILIKDDIKQLINKVWEI